MAILQVLGSDKVLRINDFNMLGLVQSEDWTPNLNAKDVQEMGNTGRLATEMELEVSGTFQISASGAVPGILARMAVKRDPSTLAYLGAVYASGGAGGKNAYTLTELDMAEMRFDLLLHERTDQRSFNRTVCFPNVFLTGMQCNVDANGSGTTTFNWAGDYFWGATGIYHDMRAFAATRTTDTTATALVAPTGYTLGYVYVNEKRFRTTNTDATYVSLSGSIVTFTTTEGFVLADTDIIKFWCYKNTPSTTLPYLSAAERSTSAYFMKGYTASMYIAPASVSSVLATEQWLRAQSMDFSIDMKVEPLRQIAYNRLGTAVYARVPTFPFDITLNATVIETDWADWKQVLSKSFPGNSFDDDVYDLAPVNQKTTFGIVVKYFTTGQTLLSEWRFTDMRIESMSNRANIGGRGEVTWGFKGNAFTLIGYNG